MTFKLQFFSGVEAYGNESGAHGYDGSMSVPNFDPADLQSYARAMDCIFGPCICIVSKGADMRAYPFERIHAD